MSNFHFMVPVYDSKRDKYLRIELDVALKNDEFFLFHPLAKNQPDVESAIFDSKLLRNPYMLADALYQELTGEYRFSNSHLREFLKRFFVLTFPAGA